MRTRSATFATSIIALISFGHSMNVILCFLPDTTVMGPLISDRDCFVYRLTRHLMRVVFPDYQRGERVVSEVRDDYKQIRKISFVLK